MKDVKAHPVHGVGFCERGLARRLHLDTLRDMTGPWNDWYHCNGNSYGTWVRGDPRGWRERNHRLHVEGDYRNPPSPSKFNNFIHARSLRSMKKRPVRLSREQAMLAGAAMVRRLHASGIELLTLVVDDHHFHLVGRFRDHQPRRYIALAKQRASYLLIRRFEGLSAPIWAKRCRCLPIENRKHQVRSVNYDLEHAARGAFFTWSFRDPVPEIPGGVEDSGADAQ